MDTFHNPYAFVPADRREDPARHKPPRDLADGPPAPLGRLHPDRWTGRLRVSLTAESPLLLTAVTRIDKVDTKDHPVRETRRDPLRPDRADLLATTVKGMLRSVFEASTNSRFGVFADHGRLTRRARTEEALPLIPGVIAKPSADGAPMVTLLIGRANLKENGKGASQCALRVPRYHPHPWQNCNVEPNGAKHGGLVIALVAEIQRNNGRRTDQLVVEIVPYDDDVEPNYERAEQRAQAIAEKLNGHWAGKLVQCRGVYVETGNTIEPKCNERLFFNDAARGKPVKLPLPEHVVNAWRTVLDSYRDNRERTEEAAKKAELDCSPFITATDERFHQWARPENSIPCYVEVQGRSLQDYEVVGLYPVAVSRRAYATTPEELAEKQNLLPVDGPQNASVADRLFGWATTQSARRGRVRIGVPVQRPDTGIQAIGDDDGVPLGVLSSPKPSYELFYAGTPDGQPARLGEGFATGGGLRGRKIYPAHPEDSRRWDAGRQQPWMRPDQKRDDQNASVLDCVPPGATFDIDIQVEDLTKIELGTLLWLLEPSRRHRVGLGRPFGFGTVSIAPQWARSELRDGAAWRSHYRLEPHRQLTGDELAEHAARFVNAFEQAVEDLYGHRRPRFLAALERALEGFPDDSTPVRYPPDPQDPGSYEDNYEWFVANLNKGARTALGDLADGWGPLPVRPEDANESRSDGRPPDRDRRRGGNSGQPRGRDNGGS